MSRSFLSTLGAILFVVSVASARAQTPPPTAAPGPGQPAPQKPQVATPPPGQPEAPPAVQRPVGINANVRIELTITDQRGAAPAVPKTISMLVSDRFNGRIRTSGTIRQGRGFAPIVLNVDAMPEVLKDGRIRLQISLEYRAQTPEGMQEEGEPPSLTESFNVILDDGKPMTVSQSADPITDRKVKVDLKATVVK